MKSPSELGESVGQAVAQKSPRMGGVLAIVLGGLSFGLSLYLSKVVLLILAGLLLGSGVWIAATGRNWKIPDEKPPMWWKAGFIVTAGVGVALSYAYILTSWSDGF